MTSGSTQSPHRIFISHSHLDNDFVTWLAQDLRQVLKDDSAVWYDILGLHGGDSWWQKIVAELTARNIFLLLLSPEAMDSKWVRREIDIALNEDKRIIPLHCRNCQNIRADLKILQIISFLAPKKYEAAFQELLTALGLPAKQEGLEPKDTITSPEAPGSSLLKQIEIAFAGQDWPDVIRKANFLLKQVPSAASAALYRMQGLALLEEGSNQEARQALETALVLVSDRQFRLTVLSDYTRLLSSQGQWAEVLQHTGEALHLAPNDPGWLATQQQAQRQLQPLEILPKPPQTVKPTQDQARQSSQSLDRDYARGKQLRLDVAQLTDVGRKLGHNEDNMAYVIPKDSQVVTKYGAMFMVADGLGEHGEVASEIAVDTVSNAYYEDEINDVANSLIRAIRRANSAIYQRASENILRNGMGTTCVAAILRGNRAYIANVGNSRAYLIHGNQIKQVSWDHSWVAEQVRAGLLTEDQARTHPQRNVITRCLGTQADVEIDVFLEQLERGDFILLCTDGLSDAVSDYELQRIVEQFVPQESVYHLVERANQNGGPDNITVIVIKILEVGSEPPNSGRRSQPR